MLFVSEQPSEIMNSFGRYRKKLPEHYSAFFPNRIGRLRA